MIIVFTKANNIGSYAIRTVTWSAWSHVAMVNCISIDSITPDTKIIDATFLHGGVKERTIGELLEPMSEWAYIDITLSDEESAWVAARAQVGKNYDWTALLGILAHRSSWSEDDAWFCNELVEFCLACGGEQRFREELSKLTPQHSWMVNTFNEPVLRKRKDGHTF